MSSLRDEKMLQKPDWNLPKSILQLSKILNQMSMKHDTRKAGRKIICAAIPVFPNKIQNEMAASDKIEMTGEVIFNLKE